MKASTMIWIAAGIFAGRALAKRSSGNAAAPPSLPRPGTKSFSVAGVNGILHVPVGRGARVLLYLHGHGDSPTHALSQISAPLDSIDNPPIVVLPQLGPKSEPGALANAGAAREILRKLGLASLPLDAMAHSGGYLPLIDVILAGGVTIRSIGLLDALYGGIATYGAFARRSTTHHLAIVAGPSTAENASLLADDVGAKRFPPGATAAPSAVRAFRATLWPTTVFHPLVPAAYVGPLAAGFGSG